MTRDKLITFWREEEAVPFQRWDFLYLNGRCQPRQYLLEARKPYSFDKLRTQYPYA